MTAAEESNNRQDDLAWLIGKWWCVEKNWLSQSDRLAGSHDEHVVEWFNVYYPYADETLKLDLTNDPEERPIAAEFIVRPSPDDFYVRRELSPMYPQSVVRIGINRIRIGDNSERLDLTYRVVTNSMRPRLEIRSKHMRLIFERMCSDSGDIHNSFVKAPIRWFSAERIADLSRQYERLKRETH